MTSEIVRTRIRELTQTVVGENGNCWQTCVACILDVDPAEMPCQATIERVTGTDENGKVQRAGSYNNPLQAYLREHHYLTLASIWQPLVGAVRVTVMNGYHLSFGPTVRTPTIGVDHVVVAREGETVWDPHPSRAGLVSVKQWAALVPFPESYNLEVSRRINACVCPRCEE